jgi:hypothetical protein
MARRAWYVPDLAVWGTADWGQLDFVAVEQVGTETSVLFGQADLGDNAQRLLFADLVDHRGNSLPSQLDMPLVLPRPRSEKAVFVVGRESNEAVVLARQADAIEPIPTDLLIIEMGD